MDNPKTDMLIQPEWSTLIFGDGYIALMQGAIEKEEGGIRIVEVTIKPHTHLRKRYNIREGDLDNNGNITSYRMKKDDLIPLNLFDDANRTFLYVKNYNHQDTDVGRMEWDLRKRLEEKDKKLWVMEGELIHQSEMLNLAKTNPMEFAALPLEIFEKMMDNMANMFSKTKREKED
ncbi:hypothetical protein CCP1ISM_60028 [Azospirillaceae bacterium]